MIISANKTKTSENLLNIMRNFGSLIEYSLSFDLNAKSLNEVNKDELTADEDGPDESQEAAKNLLNKFDRAVEAKLLSIDLVNSITGHFIPGFIRLSQLLTRLIL